MPALGAVHSETDRPKERQFNMHYTPFTTDLEFKFTFFQIDAEHEFALNL